MEWLANTLGHYGVCLPTDNFLTPNISHLSIFGIRENVNLALILLFTLHTLHEFKENNQVI